MKKRRTTEPIYIIQKEFSTAAINKHNVDTTVQYVFIIYFSVLCTVYGKVVNLLNELPHVLTECFTARPLTLSMTVERMGAGMLLVTADEGTQRKAYVKCW